MIDLQTLRSIKGAGTNDIHLEAAVRTFVLQARTPQEAEEWLKILRQSAVGPTEEVSEQSSERQVYPKW